MRHIEAMERLYKTNEKLKEEDLYLLYVDCNMNDESSDFRVYAVPRSNVQETNFDPYATKRLNIKDVKGTLILTVKGNMERQVNTETKDMVTLSDKQNTEIMRVAQELSLTPIIYRKSNRTLTVLKGSPVLYGKRFLVKNPKGEFVLDSIENVKAGTYVELNDYDLQEASAQGWDIDNFEHISDFELKDLIEQAKLEQEQ